MMSEGDQWFQHVSVLRLGAAMTQTRTSIVIAKVAGTAFLGVSEIVHPDT